MIIAEKWEQNKLQKSVTIYQTLSNIKLEVVVTNYALLHQIRSDMIWYNTY